MSDNLENSGAAMSTETQNNSVENTTQASPEVATLAPLGSTAIPTQKANTTDTQADPDPSAIPQYTPNFKFKVKDKELDFDEFLKPIIKDKATEDKVKELYEKAHGLDEVKADRGTLKEKLRESDTKFSSLEGSLKALGEYAQKKDFRTFFDILQIPKQDIINYAIEELRYQELPPEQRAIIDSQRQRDLDYQAQLSQNQTMQQQMQSMVVQQATFELNQELSKPDISAAMNAYDARVGQTGALRAEIIRRGQYYEAVRKTSPSAGQLIAEIFQFIGVNPSAQSSGGASPQGTLTPQSQAVQNQKPIIPTFSGGGSNKSPVRKTPTSIDDLRKIRQQQHT